MTDLARGRPAVLITGCSTGIGRATAERLARSGRPVYATARRPETLEGLEALGAVVLALDVTDEASMREAVATVESAHGAVGALVNNAGYGLEGPVETASEDDVRRQFDTNVFGLVRLTQLVLPAMRAAGWGRIVNVSSVGGRLTLPGGGFYHATKYAVEALSDALRFEVRGFGIGVSLVEPGIVLTSFGDTARDTIGSGGAGPDDAYGRFRHAVGERLASAYSGRLASLAISPDAVARSIERAIDARRPRARYPVGALARSGILLRRFTPDRVFDASLRLVYPTPKP